MSEKIYDKIAPGVVTGDGVQEIFRIAKANNFALPAVNVVGSNSINAVMEAAKDVNSPVIIQFSSGGGAFYAGKGVSGMEVLWHSRDPPHRPCCPQASPLDRRTS